MEKHNHYCWICKKEHEDHTVNCAPIPQIICVPCWKKERELQDKTRFVDVN